MSLVDGTRVAYIGPERDRHAIGDEGLVVEAGLDACHVKWSTGLRRNAIDLIPNGDLIPGGHLEQHAVNAVTLADDRLVSFAIRSAWDQAGTRGVIRALAHEGHDLAFEEIGTAAIAFTASRLRQDPSILEVMAELDAFEQDEFINAVALAVLHGAGR